MTGEVTPSARKHGALITASLRRSTMTYGELARAIDLDPGARS